MSNLSDIRKFNTQEHYLTLGGLFLAVSIAIFSVAVLLMADTPLTYFLVLVLLVVTLIPVFIGIASKSFDIFELIYPISAIYFLYFGVRTLYILNFPADLHLMYWGHPPTIDFDIINLTLGYTIVGFVFLLIGYCSFIPKIMCKSLPRLRLLKSSLHGRGIVKKIYLIYAVGILFRLILLSRGLGLFMLPEGADLTFLNIMQVLSGFAIFGYALYSIWLFSSSKITKRKLIPWLVMLTIEAGWAFLSGWKGAFIPLVGIPLIAYHYLRQRLSIWRILLPATVGILILIFVIFPVINAYRVIVWGEGPVVSVGEFLSHMGIVHDKLRGYSWSEFQQISLRPFMNRMVGLDSFSMILMKTPEAVDFQMGGTLRYFFIAWIPRVLWEEKPIIDIGRWFAVNFFNQPPGIQNSMAIMNIGELYLNFHILGIILGMFFLGIIYKIAYLYFVKYGKASAISVFLYIFVFFGLINIEGSIATIPVILLQTLFLLFLISWFLKIKISGNHMGTGIARVEKVP
ncbi:MAG: hypothetical protein DDT41_01612 [candidate division WS2 bacterium]|nr:hypothetical protein [Candidatus Psychracetigena formicireducens]